MITGYADDEVCVCENHTTFIKVVGTYSVSDKYMSGHDCTKE